MRNVDSTAEHRHTLVQMDRSAFAGLAPAALAWACVAPAIRHIRRRTPDVKRTVYRTLTPGQKALLMFWALHVHADSPRGFRGTLEYLVRDLQALPELRAAARHFGDTDLGRFMSGARRRSAL
jgi:hypothetical protein